MKIRILPEAERDLEIGADFYESQSLNLGLHFHDCLALDIDSLRIHAGIHVRVHGLFRCLSKRFPFAIFYDFDGDAVSIYAVLDCRQDPDKIDTRLKNVRKNKP